MPLFRVMCYREGAWDRQEPRVVDAQTAMDAVEKVSRERLVRGLVERSPVYFKVWPHIRYAEWFSVSATGIPKHISPRHESR